MGYCYRRPIDARRASLRVSGFGSTTAWFKDFRGAAHWGPATELVLEVIDADSTTGPSVTYSAPQRLE